MCAIEDVFHNTCGHWGQQKFSGEPCIRSRSVSGIAIRCSYHEVIGMANSKDPCWLCKRASVSGSSSSLSKMPLTTPPQTPDTEISQADLETKMDGEGRGRRLSLVSLRRLSEFGSWNQDWTQGRRESQSSISTSTSAYSSPSSTGS